MSPTPPPPPFTHIDLVLFFAMQNKVINSIGEHITNLIYRSTYIFFASTGLLRADILVHNVRPQQACRGKKNVRRSILDGDEAREKEGEREGRERERKKERQRETETERQRQTDRQTDRQTENPNIKNKCIKINIWDNGDITSSRLLSLICDLKLDYIRIKLWMFTLHW